MQSDGRTLLLGGFRDETALAALLTVAFGAAYWQINHLLHYFSGLTFEQVQANPSIAGKGIGETPFDPYMGIAQLALLSCGMAISYVACRGRVSAYTVCLIAVPILVNVALLQWRDRPSTSAFSFSAMQSLILALLVQAGSLREQALALPKQIIGGMNSGTLLLDLKEGVSIAWIAAPIAAILTVVCLLVSVVTVYVSEENQDKLVLTFAERKVLSVVFALAAVALFCEAIFLVWERTRKLKAFVTSLPIAQPNSTSPTVTVPSFTEAASVQTILFLAANPKDSARLRLDEEVKRVEQGLERSKHRDRFRLIQKWAVTAIDLRRALLDYKPLVVHFSGHGSDTDALLLENDEGNLAEVSTEALADLFELSSTYVRCVLLNACYSVVQGKAIVKHIPHVIGMERAIGDGAAIEFAVGFYDALGAGEDFEKAFRYGSNAISLKGIPESKTPMLLRRTEDGGASKMASLQS